MKGRPGRSAPGLAASPRATVARARPIRLAPVPPDTYLTGILASHRARAAADDRSLDALVAEAQSGPAPRPFAGRLAAVDRGRARRHRRGQAALAVQGGPRRRPRSGPGGRRLRGGRSRLRVGAHRRRVLRRVPAGPPSRPGGLHPPRAAQGLHGVRGRRLRRPAHGSRCRAAHRGRAVGRRARQLSEPGPGAARSTPWSRCTTRPSWSGPSTPGPSSSGSTSAT